MTATDELRRLLDERGARWEDMSDFGVAATEWRSYDGSPCTALESDERPLLGVPDGKLSVEASITPEQAIEATLGRGECRDAAGKQMAFFSCSVCGATTERKHPRFCFACGRKVVDE